MGHSHAHRPYVSRRDFLRRSALVGAAGAAAVGGAWFWCQPAYGTETPVSQVHVNFGADAAREMTVSWMTPGPVRNPFVQLADERVAARTAQYPGYPGYFHHARLTRLLPGTTYGYRIGQDDKAVTPAYGFTTGPRGREKFTFTAFGDQGTDVATTAQQPIQPSMNTKLAQSFNPAFHVIVGDLAYANGDQKLWDEWFDMISPMATSTPWMPCIGNHEIESQLDVLGTGDSWGELGYDPYLTRFALPGNGYPELENCFYSFRYGSAVFISVDNNDVNREIKHNIGYTGGRQRQWVEKALAAAHADKGVDFIVVLMHQAAFSSSSRHGSDDGVREAWLELFARYGVDLVLQGHDHNYERSHVLRGDQVVADIPNRLDLGTAYILCGNGGAVQDSFDPVQPAWSAYRQAFKIGTLKVEVDPLTADGMSRLTLGEYWALDGSPIEEGIVLEKPAKTAAKQTVAGTNATQTSTTISAPTVTLPAADAPAGTTLIGVEAGAAGLAMRVRSREEALDEGIARA